MRSVPGAEAGVASALVIVRAAPGCPKPEHVGAGWVFPGTERKNGVGYHQDDAKRYDFSHL